MVGLAVNPMQIPLLVMVLSPGVIISPPNVASMAVTFDGVSVLTDKATTGVSSSVQLANARSVQINAQLIIVFMLIVFDYDY